VFIIISHNDILSSAENL